MRWRGTVKPMGEMGVELDCLAGVVAAVLMLSRSVRRGCGEWVRRLFFAAARASSSLGLPGLLRMGGRVVDMLSLAKACAKDGSMTDEDITISFFGFAPCNQRGHMTSLSRANNR